MPLLWKIHECYDDTVSALDALEQCDPENFTLDEEKCEKLRECKDDLSDAEHQYIELCKLKPQHCDSYNRQLLQVHAEIEQRIKNLHISGFVFSE